MANQVVVLFRKIPELPNETSPERHDMIYHDKI